jgi:hypothetical protein
MDKHKPTLKPSTAKADSVKEVENRQFEIEFKADYDAYSKRNNYLKLIPPKLMH